VESAQYLKEYESKKSYYYRARQHEKESLIEYFHRYNTLAVKAGIDYKVSESREHIKYFINSLYDRKIADQMCTSKISSISELEDIIDNIQTRIKLVYEPRSGPTVKTIESNSATGFGYGSDYTNVDDKNESQSEEHSMLPMEKTKCTMCNRTGHSATNCWKDITCTGCQQKGHPVKYCSRSCKVCHTMHDSTAVCPAVKKITDWIKDQGIVLPADVAPSSLN
jgi:hypothetical protein